MTDKRKSQRSSLMTKVTGFVKALFRGKNDMAIDHKVDPGYLPSRMCPTVALDRVSTGVDRGRMSRRKR